MINLVSKKIVKLLDSELTIFQHSKDELICVKYFSDVVNWGDAINVDIIEYLSNKKVVNCPLGHRKHLLGIGSVLVTANQKSIVWGSGFLSERQKIKAPPIKVCSVRGPLSKKMLNIQGVDCPSIFGDPALLLSEVFPEIKTIRRTHKLGVIPHYQHINHNWIRMLAQDDDVKIIDIRTADSRAFIDEINSCEYIASSSLHGIIASDACGIPNCRLQILKMNAFKFDDYHLGVGVNNYVTISIEDNCNYTAHYIVQRCQYKEIQFDASQLKKAFPLEF